MKNKKPKRLTPRKFHDIPYVLGSDIREFHGTIWSKKYSKISGINTGIIVPANDPSHNKSKEQYGIYYWDYERFANVVDFNIPTYFD